MNLYKFKWTIPKDEDGANLCALSDIHKGNRYHNKPIYERNLKWLHEHKEFKIITLGDLIECSTKHSVGLNDQIMEVEDQIDEIIDDLTPLAEEGRLIGMIQGNHERRALKEASIDVTKRIAKQLDVTYMGVGAILYTKIKNGNNVRGQNYITYAIHGSSAARTAGGRINAVMRMGNIVNADLYLHAHLHCLDHEVQDIHEVIRGRVRLKRKHYVITGGYLTYGGYVEERGYAPAGPSGSARIKFHSDEHRITVKI